MVDANSAFVAGRYDGYYQMPDPDPEDKLGHDYMEYHGQRKTRIHLMYLRSTETFEDMF
jgi:hypothetical protein